MNSNEVLLSVEDLAVRFGGLVALDGVNLKVKPQRLMALIGPNGAGKTTLFNAITGLVKAERGRVMFGGRDLTSLPPHQVCKMGLARSFQLTSIFPELTVFDNVWLGINAQSKTAWHPLSRGGRRGKGGSQVESYCEQTGLQDKLDVLAGNLSHGDQKLLELAITMSLEPRLLLLDEPTQGVSPNEIELINQVIRAISQTRTVLLIDHNMSTVRELAEVVAVLHQGRIIMEGDPIQVILDKRVREVYLGQDFDGCGI